MRFRQCMTRGMTYIKMYIIKTLRDLGYEIYKKTSQKVVVTDVIALMVNEVAINTLMTLGTEIECCSTNHTFVCQISC